MLAAAEVVRIMMDLLVPLLLDLEVLVAEEEVPQYL
jgi:hypothetical protein